MRDITNEVLRAPDRKSGAKIEGLTRLDLVRIQVRAATARMGQRRRFRITVLNADGGVEQDETGGPAEAMYLAELYGFTHSLRVTADARGNRVAIRLGGRVAHPGDGWQVGGVQGNQGMDR